MATLTLELTAPNHPPIQQDATEVVLPGSAGVFTVLPGHTPILTTLTRGALVAYNGEEKTFYAVHDGFAEVLEDKVVVLAEILERAEDIDHTRAHAAAERARERLAKPSPDMDIRRAQAALARAAARLQALAREEH